MGTGGAGGAGTGGAAGGSGIVYSGCSFLGDIDRVVVDMYDPARGVCVVVVFGGGSDPAGILLPANFGIEEAYAAPSGGPCARRFPPAMAVTSYEQRGTASWTSTTAHPYATADVFLALSFPPGPKPLMGSEMLVANGVDVSRPCTN